MFLFCFTHHISNDHVHSLKPGLNFLMLCSNEKLECQKTKEGSQLNVGLKFTTDWWKTSAGWWRKEQIIIWILGEWGKKGQNRFTRRGFHYPVTYKEQTECPMMREGPQFYYTAAGCCISQLCYSVLVTYIGMFCFFKKKKKRTITCK